MDFFDKLGKKATEAYKITADKTGKIAKDTKLKIKMSDLKSQIDDIYEKIGQEIYRSYTLTRKISIEEDVEKYCIRIDELSQEIENLLKQSLELNDKKKCEKCFKELNKNDKFCTNCGEKQEDKDKNVDVTQYEYEEEIEQQEEKDNLEKTIEIESNVNLDKDVQENIIEINKESEEDKK